MIVAVGGPCYRYQLSASHAMMLAQLGMACHGPRTETKHVLGTMIYEHTSVLPAGRADVLFRAMASDAHALLSVDADTWMDAEVALRVLDVADRLFDRADVAALGVCVPQDDGRVNAWRAEGERIEQPKPWKPFPVHAIGAGITVHNLEWHRREAKRSNGRWPWTAYAVIPSGLPNAFYGEDYVYCERVRAEAGVVLAVYTAGGVYHGRGY